MQRYKKPIVIVMVLSVISALFFALVPASEDSGGSSPAPKTPTVIPISVADGKVTGGGGDITVKQGSQVILSVTADVSDEVHVHGYDLKTNVTPNQPAIIPFTTTAAGKFEVELEEAALPLAEITIVP